MKAEERKTYTNMNFYKNQIEDALDFVNVSDLRIESSSIISIVESALLSTDVPKSVKVNMPKNVKVRVAKRN